MVKFKRKVHCEHTHTGQHIQAHHVLTIATLLGVFNCVCVVGVLCTYILGIVGVEFFTPTMQKEHPQGQSPTALLHVLKYPISMYFGGGVLTKTHTITHNTQNRM